MVVTVLTRYDVDRKYRSLALHLAAGGDLWITRPSYDTQPRRRRQAGELPGDVIERLNLVEIMDRPFHKGGLSAIQRMAFRLVVMGIERRWSAHEGRYTDYYRDPMTYEQAADALDVSEGVIRNALGHARVRLARLLSEDEP